MERHIATIHITAGREVLIVQSPRWADLHWSIPGDRVQEVETLQQAAQRIVRDEIGIFLEEDNFKYVASKSSTTESGVLRIVYLLRVRLGQWPALPMVGPRDHLIRRVLLTELFRYLTRREVAFMLQ